MKTHEIKAKLFLSIAMVVMAMISVPSAWAAGENITGKWKFNLKPTVNIDGSNAKSSEQIVNLYDVNGGIVGFSGLFEFQGSRRGKVVTLDVFSRDGHKKVNHKTTLNLTVHLPTPGYPYTMVGTEVSNDVDLGYKGLNASKVSATRIGNSPSINVLKTARADTWPVPVGEEALPNSASDWITKIITYIANKYVINELTWNSCSVTYDWMQAWDVTEDGAGYYMAGNQAPGGRSYATWTFYYPLDWGHGGDRTYSFTFHSQSVYQTIAQLSSTLQTIGNAYPKCLGFSGNGALISAVQDFYNQFGDFAISTAYDDNTANTDMYINLANAANCGGAKEHPLIQSIWGQLSDHDELLCGHDINDTWNLKRPYFLLDGTALYITNVLGTINVWYD